MIEQRHALHGARTFPLLVAGLRVVVVARYQFQTVRLRKRFGALAREQHVLAVIHDRARGQYRVAQPRDAGHRAGIQGCAIHDGGIEFVGARMREHSALACIEQRALFEQAHGFGHRVDGRTAAGQHALASLQNLFQRLDVFAFAGGIHRGACNGAGAAVDGNDCLIHGGLRFRMLGRSAVQGRWFAFITGRCYRLS